ncbi:MAG: hypothetical protein R3281_18010 [Balneolaceae bacterium]|nr:hypothetical protein [Balneolaceae bacterium]
MAKNQGMPYASSRISTAVEYLMVVLSVDLLRAEPDDRGLARS